MERACQAIGLLGVSKEERRLLVGWDVDTVARRSSPKWGRQAGRSELAVANALGGISSHED